MVEKFKKGIKVEYQNGTYIIDDIVIKKDSILLKLYYLVPTYDHNQPDNAEYKNVNIEVEVDKNNKNEFKFIN